MRQAVYCPTLPCSCAALPARQASSISAPKLQLIGTDVTNESSCLFTGRPEERQRGRERTGEEAREEGIRSKESKRHQGNGWNMRCPAAGELLLLLRCCCLK